MSGLDRDAVSADALLTDLYLDAVLAGAVLDAAEAAESSDPGRRLDPLARAAADRLRRDLVRVHPSFRFEERLATRLAAAAVAMRIPLAAGSDGRLVPFRPGRDTSDPAGPDADVDPTTTPDDAALDALVATLDHGDPARRDRPRPLLIGGALTSAAISIAGAAWVAWRFGRPGRPGRGLTPMARAARAVRDARHEALGVVSSFDPTAIKRRLD